MMCCLAASFQFFPQTIQAGQSQAGMPSSSSDAQTLRQAKGAYNTNNLLVAKQLAEKIRDAPGSVGEEARNLIRTIDDINSNNKKKQSAELAIRRGKFENACSLLREIQAAVDANVALKERYPDLNDMMSKAGGCPQAPVVEQPDPRDYENALDLKNKGKLNQALEAFNRIEKSHPGYLDVKQQIEEVRQKIKMANLKKTQDEQFAEQLAEAEQLLNSGDFNAAQGVLDAAEALRHADPKVNEMRQQLETAITNEENKLVEAVNSFYSGRYEQAQRALGDFLQVPHSPSVRALARFYQGAALGSRFFLGGGKDEEARGAAIQLFRQALKDDPSYSPHWDAISPKIRDLYLAATKQQQ
jgi:tetratricopeptide (TPR) repeat protein